MVLLSIYQNADNYCKMKITNCIKEFIYKYSVALCYEVYVTGILCHCIIEFNYKTGLCLICIFLHSI